MQKKIPTIPKKVLKKILKKDSKNKLSNTFQNLNLGLNLGKLLRTLSISLMVCLIITLTFWAGFQFVNFTISESNKNARADFSGTTLNTGTYNNCSYNGSFCSNTSGLVSWFDAGNTKSYPGTGQVIYDLSGNNANGTFGLDTNTSTDDPVFNSSGVKSFGFVNASEVISTSVLTNFSADFTLEVWFKRSNNTDTVSGCERLMNMNSNIVNAARGSLALCGKNVAARGRTTDNLSAWIKNTGFAANTDWQMATLTYNSTSQSMQIYVNAVVHSSSTQAILPGTNVNILIGASAGVSNAQNFVGQIAVTRIYNRALTASDITTNFNAEKSRFGFTNSVINTILPTTVNFGNYQTSSSEQTVNILLDQIKIVDRRGTFGAYSVNLGISNFGSNSNLIKREKVSINLGTPTTETGSGIFNTSGTGGQLDSSRNLVTNTTNNGGGTFIYKPTLTLKIPPYSKLGNYTAVISISVS